MTSGDRGDECPVKWCDEAGAHVVHRQYVASLPGGLRGSGVVGVNIAQRVWPRGSVCVELTVTTARASTAGCAIAAPCVPDIAAALTKAADRAAELDAARQRNG